MGQRPHVRDEVSGDVRRLPFGPYGGYRVVVDLGRDPEGYLSCGGSAYDVAGLVLEASAPEIKEEQVGVGDERF